MESKIDTHEQEKKDVDVKIQSGASDTVYGLGLIGAWVYFIGRAETNQDRVKGFFKGFIWPAILVYRLFELLDKE